jgi:hypothetical protein
MNLTTCTYIDEGRRDNLPQDLASVIIGVITKLENLMGLIWLYILVHLSRCHSYKQLTKRLELECDRCSLHGQVDGCDIMLQKNVSVVIDVTRKYIGMV